MPLRFWGISGVGVKLHAGDTGPHQYGGNGKPVPGNQGYITTGKYGRKLVPVHLFGHRHHIECGPQRRTAGSAGRTKGEAKEKKKAADAEGKRKEEEVEEEEEKPVKAKKEKAPRENESRHGRRSR